MPGKVRTIASFDGTDICLDCLNSWVKKSSTEVRILKEESDCQRVSINESADV